MAGERARRIAIVGSREFSDMNMVRDFVEALPVGTVVVSGGARGVDRVAATAAKNAGLEVVEYRPYNPAKHGDYAARNAVIVRDCDELVAFHDGSSRGTAMTIEMARKAGRPVTVRRATAPGATPGDTP